MSASIILDIFSVTFSLDLWPSDQFKEALSSFVGGDQEDAVGGETGTGTSVAPSGESENLPSDAPLLNDELGDFFFFISNFLCSIRLLAILVIIYNFLLICSFVGFVNSKIEAIKRTMESNMVLNAIRLLIDIILFFPNSILHYVRIRSSTVFMTLGILGTFIGLIVTMSGFAGLITELASLSGGDASSTGADATQQANERQAIRTEKLSEMIPGMQLSFLSSVYGVSSGLFLSVLSAVVESSRSRIRTPSESDITVGIESTDGGASEGMGKRSQKNSTGDFNITDKDEQEAQEMLKKYDELLERQEKMLELLSMAQRTEIVTANFKDMAEEVERLSNSLARAADNLRYLEEGMARMPRKVFEFNKDLRNTVSNIRGSGPEVHRHARHLKR